MSLYADIVDDLTKEIANLQKGDQLPSERQLCTIYNVSRTTIRSAINELVNSGLIYQIHGKGTFATGKSKDQDNLNKYYSFTQRIKANGQTPKSIILDFDIIEAGEEISKKLKLCDNELVISFVRLRLADDEPMMYEITYIPYKRFEHISRKTIETTPLYDIFDQRASTKIFNVNERFSVGIIPKEVCQYLLQKENDPCLNIVRRSYDFNDEVLEYTISYARRDKFYYETNYSPV